MEQKETGMAVEEPQEKIIDKMKRWQEIEDEAVSSSSKIYHDSDNAVVQQIMEIIHMDSQIHRRVQQMIIDSLAGEAITLASHDVAAVCGLLVEHMALEKKTEEIIRETFRSMSHGDMVVQRFLMDYLQMDEEKHGKLLRNLQGIIRGTYPGG